MKIIVFTKIKNIEKTFCSLKLPKEHTLECQSITELKKTIKAPDTAVLYYIDISSLEETQVKRTVTQLQKTDLMHYGIIDPKNTIIDIAQLFFNGAVDYIGKSLLKENLKPKRLVTAAELITSKIQEKQPAEEAPEKARPEYILSSDGWKGIKSNQEYTFTMMYVELDNIKEIKRTYGVNQFDKLTETFQKFIEETVTPLNGKLWMWMDYFGLILFPFDGESCQAIETCFKLNLNRPLICYEKFDFDFSFTFKIAIHIGNTLYKKRGATGDIISDSINSIFHLGQKYAEPGYLYITEDAVDYIPKQLADYFKPAGYFENREHYRMKKILY